MALWRARWKGSLNKKLEFRLWHPLKHFWSSHQAALKPSSTLLKPLKPFWSRLQAPWSPLQLEAPLKPFSSPLQAPWSPSQAALKPPWSPSQASLKPLQALEGFIKVKPLQAPLQSPLRRWRVLFVLAFGSFGCWSSSRNKVKFF